MAEQTALQTVAVSWTAPSPPPSQGYRIIVDSTDTSTGVDVQQSPHTITLQPGVHSIRLVALPVHMRSEVVGPVEVTVRGEGECACKFITYIYTYVGFLPPVVTPSPTATSVTITWTQPEFSFPVVDYTVSLTRVTGSGQVLCPSVMDSRPSVTTMATVTSMEFTGLQEFSVYTVTVTARLTTTFGLMPIHKLQTWSSQHSALV